MPHTARTHVINCDTRSFPASPQSQRSTHMLVQQRHHRKVILLISHRSSNPPHTRCRNTVKCKSKKQTTCTQITRYRRTYKKSNALHRINFCSLEQSTFRQHVTNVRVAPLQMSQPCCLVLYVHNLAKKKHTSSTPISTSPILFSPDPASHACPSRIPSGKIP